MSKDLEPAQKTALKKTREFLKKLVSEHGSTNAAFAFRKVTNDLKNRESLLKKKSKLEQELKQIDEQL